MRLIDANATIKYVRELDDTPLYYVRDIIDTVEYFLAEDISPTIDAVPVVRCKDCIHWDGEHTEECDNLDSICFHNGVCKPDWHCGDGKRR